MWAEISAALAFIVVGGFAFVFAMAMNGFSPSPSLGNAIGFGVFMGGISALTMFGILRLFGVH